MTIESFTEPLSCTREILHKAFGHNHFDNEKDYEWTVSVNERMYVVHDARCGGVYIKGKTEIESDILAIKQFIYNTIGNEHKADFVKWANRYITVCIDEHGEGICRPLGEYPGNTPMEMMKHAMDYFFCTDENEKGTWWQQYQESMLYPVEVMEAYFDYKNSQ